MEDLLTELIAIKDDDSTDNEVLGCVSNAASLIHRESEDDIPSFKETIWNCMLRESETDFLETIDFRSKIKNHCEIKNSPLIEYLEVRVFSVLIDIMEQVLFKAIETDSLKYQKSPFNGLDHIAEMLWNWNPLCPERGESYTFIHDIEWVQKFLEENPRPYFPLSWIFTKDIAATKIQAFVRGYWVRKRENVQEMRQFWKELKKEKREEANIIEAGEDDFDYNF